MNLRPFQQECLTATERALIEFDRVLIVAPTGSGKTVMFSKTCEWPGRTLVIAHREELINQAIDKIRQSTGIVCGKEKAESDASLKDRVVVASVQTMRRRLEDWPADHFARVIVDEAHHCVSNEWQTVLRHFEPAQTIGFTATPDRGDHKNLGCYFQTIAYEIGLFDLIKQGYLCPIKIKSIPLNIDISKVKQSMGDFSEVALDSALRPYFPAIVDSLIEHAAFRRILVFLPLRSTSRDFVAVAKSRGIAAKHIDGDSTDRREILDNFAAGDFDLLSNAMLLTEGYDDKGIDCVVNLRPTRSRSLYSQIVGRGTRIDACKPNLLLIDYLWQHEKHNLIRPAHLIAKTQEEAQIITEISQKYGCQELDLQEVASDAKWQREESLRKKLDKNKKRKAVSGDAMDFCLTVHSDAVDYQPTMPWHSKPVTKKQAEILADFKIKPETVRDAGQASKVIDTLMLRRKMGLASPGQVRVLKNFNHPAAATITAENATAYLDRVIGKTKKPEPQLI